MLEPMVVITYITDQQNRMVGRTQHFMNGFYMQDGSFINVIYQRESRRARRAVRDSRRTCTIPVGTYKFDEATFTYNTNPAKRFYERFTCNPMEFYGGTKQAVTAAVGVRGEQPPVERAAVQPQRREDAVGRLSSRTWQSCASTTRCRRARRSAA